MVCIISIRLLILVLVLVFLLLLLVFGILFISFTLFDDDIHYYFSNSFIIGIGIVISIGDSIGIGNSISDWYY